jgi:hypothetical protein
MMWTISGNQLLLEDGHAVSFPLPISECQQVEDVLVVVLDVSGRNHMTENVFGVTPQGQILWQIEPRPDISRDPVNFYTGIDRHLPGRIRLGSWAGIAVDVDIHSGKIVNSFVTK